MVRIASVSDLHTDFEANRQAVVGLAAQIYRQGADAVVIAGDVSHKDDRIDRAIRAFREVSEVVAYIPGNHDLWIDVDRADRAGVDTWRRYREDLRSIVEAAGGHYLPAHPLMLGAVAVVGGCGWYDYSLAPSWLRDTVDETQIAAKRYGRIQWSDRRFISFRDDDGELMSDPEVARRMESELEAQLERMENDEDVHDVVAVTHVQAFDEIVHRTGTLPWEYFTSFMGSRRLGEMIMGFSKVRVAIYGHSHIVGEHLIEGRRVYGTPLGYPRERVGVSEDELIETRIGWVEI